MKWGSMWVAVVTAQEQSLSSALTEDLSTAVYRREAVITGKLGLPCEAGLGRLCSVPPVLPTASPSPV